MTTDPLDLYRDRAREQWQRVTAWRLGYMVGLAGQRFPSPYAEGTRSTRNYFVGINDGDQARRIDRQRELNGEPSRWPAGWRA